MALKLKKPITIILVVSGVAVLLKLGFWQVERLAWKNDIIAQLEKEYQKDPDQNNLTFRDLTNIEPQEIRYGSVTGTLQTNKVIFKGPKPYEGKIGYDVISPFQLKEGYILVNRGWIEEKSRNALKEKKITISKASGVFRYPDWNRFTSNNNPENNIWTKLDINEMADHFQVTPITPVMMFMISNKAESELLSSQDQKWYPRNKHQQYAIFWFSMAFLLLFLSILTIKRKN